MDRYHFARRDNCRLAGCGWPVRCKSRRSRRKDAYGHDIGHQDLTARDHHLAARRAGRDDGIPVICDGGFRRGTDIFKGVALSATAIGIGRPYIWGLAAFGQEGVETVLAILRREFELAMKQSGTTSIAKITRAHTVPRA